MNSRTPHRFFSFPPSHPGDALLWHPRAAVIFLVLGLLVPVPATAQAPLVESLYSFAIEGQSTRADVPVNGNVLLPLVFRDFSRDSPSAYNPTAPPNTLLFHQVSFEVVPLEADPGWTVFPPTSLTTYGGTDWPIQVAFQVTPQAHKPVYPVELRATATASDRSTHQANITLMGFSLGANSFGAQVGTSFQAGPNEILSAPVRIINLAIGPRQFDMEVASNPCGMDVATQNNNLVPGKGTEVYTVSLRTPATKLWYFSESCTVAVKVFPSGQPDVFQQAFISVQVSGGYVNPVWVFQAVGLAILLLAIFLVLSRRKARIEEEILGKPQKPWLIPVEALYLKALKQKDERAWYVVRHYLMEDEYRSSLLWYKDFKRATKGSRSKERLVLRQEKSYERWKRQWLRAIARPLRQADRFEESLQRKLDRKAKGILRKQVGKYRKVTGKMRAAHAKQVERAGKAHAKAVAKAAKKGLPAPKRPSVPEPDYPDEPQLAAIPLSTHKWARKAARFRARKVRQQGDLEVKFERADARRLRKVRRKVQRLARKLDDPTFVNEHPLLKGT